LYLYTEMDSLKVILKQSGIVAFLFAWNYWGVSVSNASPALPGWLEVILSLFPMPITILLSRWIYKRHYSRKVWIGFSMLFVGLVLSGLLPAYIGDNPQTSNNSTSPVVPPSEKLKWSAIFIAGNIPLGILPLFFEGFHKATGSNDGGRVTLEYRMIWTNVLLTIWIFLLTPYFMVLDQSPNLSYAADCVFRKINYHPDDICQDAGWILFTTIPIAAAQMHSQVVLSRSESGVFGSLVTTLGPFLATPIFVLLPQPYYQPINNYVWIGAVLCIVGIIIYAIGENESKNLWTNVNVEDSWLIRPFRTSKVKISTLDSTIQSS